jgi:superfamily II DNA/RNA helicase
VGTTKGISAKVSRTLNHLDLPRVINHAKGTPARRSKAATINAITKELEIEIHAEFTSLGWFRKLCIAGALITMPIMGGTRITAKKIMIAER